MKINKKAELKYGEQALKYVRLHGGANLPTIRPRTSEWDAWRRYFVDHLGFLPYAMHRILNETGDGEMTVPTEQPEQFDASYAAAIELKRRLDRRSP